MRTMPFEMTVTEEGNNHIQNAMVHTGDGNILEKQVMKELEKPNIDLRDEIGGNEPIP